jgi:hypothetical protein
MVMDPVHSSVDHGRHRSTVDRGQGLDGGSLEDGQNSAPMRGTLPWLRKKGAGNGGDPHRLQEGAAEGRK